VPDLSSAHDHRRNAFQLLDFDSITVRESFSCNINIQRSGQGKWGTYIEFCEKSGIALILIELGDRVIVAVNLIYIYLIV
jgi:hypothetical protein